MPPPLTPEKRRQIAISLRDDRLGLKRTAQKCGVGFGTVERIRKALKDHPEGYEIALNLLANGAMHVGQSHTRTNARTQFTTQADRTPAAALRALDDIDLFARRYCGLLSFPWQQQAAEVIVQLLASDEDEFCVINCPPGGGKALALNTPIPTPTGWTTMAELRVGDDMFDDQGQPCQVTAKSPVFTGHDCYTVTSSDGATVIADADHLWTVQLREPRTSEPETHRTADLAGRTAYLPVTAPLDLPDADLPIDPYTLGVWLGDGNSRDSRITKNPADASHIRAHIEHAGYTTHTTPKGFRVGGPSGILWKRDGLITELRVNNLTNNKHIPPAYLRGSVKQRLALLQGLIDTDGHVAPNGAIEFSTTRPAIAYPALELIRSLGVKASLGEGRARLYGKDCGPKFRICFRMAGAARLPRKADLTVDLTRGRDRRITITPTGSVPTQCVTVNSANQLYLAGEGFLVTHNSTWFTYVLVAWLIARDRSLRSLIGSANQSRADEYLNRLKRLLTTDIPIRNDPREVQRGLATDAVACMAHDYGIFRPDERSGYTWAASAFDVIPPPGFPPANKEKTCTAFGRSTGFLGWRGNFEIWDDVYDADQVRTDEMHDRLHKWWDNNAVSRLEPGGLLVLQGQRLGVDDLYRYCLDKQAFEDDDETEQNNEPVVISTAHGDVELDTTRRDKQYKHIIYKAHYDELCTGKHDRRAVTPWPDSCLLSPTRLSWRKLSTIKLNEPGKFATLYQQEDTPSGSTLVHPLWVTGGTDKATGEQFPGCWDWERAEWTHPGKNLKGGLFVAATVDPSPTKWWAIQAWAFHHESQQRFLIASLRVKMGGPELLDWDENRGLWTGFMEDWQTLSEHNGMKISHWIIEENAAQRWLFAYQHVHRWKAKRGVTIVGHNTARNKADEKLGVTMLSPHWRYGRVRLPGLGEGKVNSGHLVAEATAYPEGRTNDQVMASWFFEHNLDRLYTPAGHNVVHMASRPSWAARYGRTG